MSDTKIIAGIDYENIQAAVEAQLGRTPNGWSGLVVDLFESIKARCDENKIEYPQVTQIKEKFGQLRIYGNFDDDTIQGWVAAAVLNANNSCEQCGNAAQTQLIAGRYAKLCCWCAHDASRNIYNEHKRRLFGLTDAPEHLTCSVCRYVGQIDRTDKRGRCSACVKKGRQ